MTAPRNLRRTARRRNTVARLIVAATVVAAAGAGVLSGSAGADDVPRPAVLVGPAVSR
ncbi:hypothetical protein [Pseudonocardia sediminis]|nr:hypothetical protein [Pseudonocardia sediminis]